MSFFNSNNTTDTTNTMINTMTNTGGFAMNTTNLIDDNNLAAITSLATRAQLVEMSVSGWNASGADSVVTNQVAQDNNVMVSAKEAGTYNKKLLPGCKQLKEINSFIGSIRTHHLQVTSPWSTNGIRLLANSFLFEYNTWFNTMRNELFQMVDQFCLDYPTLVDDFESGARFKLGDLYRPTDYPSVEEVRAKFKMTIDFMPVPVAGNFIIDTANAARDEIIAIATRNAHNRMAGAMQETWEKLHTVLSNISKKLADSDDGNRQIFRDSLLGNAHDLLSMLAHLNFTQDPTLDAAAGELRRVLLATNIKEIRDDSNERRHVKAKVDDILSKFNF